MPSLVYALPAGKQAEVINILLKDFVEGHPVSDQRLKEVLGHTPVQVHPCSPAPSQADLLSCAGLAAHCWHQHVAADMLLPVAPDLGSLLGSLGSLEDHHAALCMHTAHFCIRHGIDCPNGPPACMAL